MDLESLHLARPQLWRCLGSTYPWWPMVAPMSIHDSHSAMGRGIDVTLGSNRFAFAGWGVALLALMAKAVLAGEPSIPGALMASIAVFLGWAVGRELDPDTPGVAAAAMVLSLAAALWSAPSALATGLILIAVRLVAGTVGKSLTRIDIVALGVIGGAVGIEPLAWVAGLTMLIWLRSAPEAGPRSEWGQLVFVAGAVTGAVTSWLWWWEGGPFASSVETTAYVLAALAGGAMILSARPMPVRSTADVSGETLDPRRIRLARIAAGSSCMWAPVVAGVEGFWQVAPVCAALVVAAIYRVFVHPAATGQSTSI